MQMVDESVGWRGVKKNLNSNFSRERSRENFYITRQDNGKQDQTEHKNTTIRQYDDKTRQNNIEKESTGTR